MKLRDVVIFFAGAQFFHTISHIVLACVIQFPIHMNFMVLTSTFNFYAILFNAVVTVVLLWWARKLS